MPFLCLLWATFETPCSQKGKVHERWTSWTYAPSQASLEQQRLISLRETERGTLQTDTKLSGPWPNRTLMGHHPPAEKMARSGGVRKTYNL